MMNKKQIHNTKLILKFGSMIVLIFALSSVLNVLINNLNLLTFLLNKAIIEGMSTEFMLIFIIAGLWITVQIIGLIIDIIIKLSK